jgi:hypothetical protein
MIDVASRVGWLTASQRTAELARMIDDRLRATDLGAADVETVCRLNQRHDLDAIGPTLAALRARSVAASAILACLGNREAHAALLEALTTAPAHDVTIAQVYLRHHPIVDPVELRRLAVRIGDMHDASAQVRALATLADHPVSDVESLESLARLFPVARDIGVQRAIAGVLIRSDYGAIAKPELVRALREKRLKSPDGQDLIDILIRRMQAALGKVA